MIQWFSASRSATTLSPKLTDTVTTPPLLKLTDTLATPPLLWLLDTEAEAVLPSLRLTDTVATPPSLRQTDTVATPPHWDWQAHRPHVLHCDWWAQMICLWFLHTYSSSDVSVLVCSEIVCVSDDQSFWVCWIFTVQCKHELIHVCRVPGVFCLPVSRWEMEKSPCQPWLPASGGTGSTFCRDASEPVNHPITHGTDRPPDITLTRRPWWRQEGFIAAQFRLSY